MVGISVLVGVPAAYVLARRNFPGKRLVYLLFLLPILMPPITYGIPLATVLYKFGFAGHLSGVVLANLVPSVPFVILTMTPFIEQIDPRIERAARMCGAGTRHGLPADPRAAAGARASWPRRSWCWSARSGMFELTFLTAGPDSQTLVVALYYSMSAAGIRAQQSVDAMAVIYTVDDAGAAGGRAALRQPDPAGRPGEGRTLRMNSSRLSLTNLPVAPAVDPKALSVGIVHLGIGAFHRAHQAVVTERAAVETGETRWGISGVSQRSTTVRDQLAPQDGLYSVLERGLGEPSVQVIGSIREVLTAPEDPEAVVARIADPAVSVVTLTVTEKGYRAAGAGLTWTTQRSRPI